MKLNLQKDGKTVSPKDNTSNSSSNTQNDNKNAHAALESHFAKNNSTAIENLTSSHHVPVAMEQGIDKFIKNPHKSIENEKDNLIKKVGNKVKGGSMIPDFKKLIKTEKGYDKATNKINKLEKEINHINNDLQDLDTKLNITQNFNSKKANFTSKLLTQEGNNAIDHLKHEEAHEQQRLNNMNAYINKQKKNVAPVALAKAKNIKRSVDQAKSKLKEVVKNINSLENQLNQIEKINENFSKIADISKGKKIAKFAKHLKKFAENIIKKQGWSETPPINWTNIISNWTNSNSTTQEPVSTLGLSSEANSYDNALEDHLLDEFEEYLLHALKDHHNDKKTTLSDHSATDNSTTVTHVENKTDDMTNKNNATDSTTPVADETETTGTDSTTPVADDMNDKNNTTDSSTPVADETETTGTDATNSTETSA
jgi:hypothetical protein